MSTKWPARGEPEHTRRSADLSPEERAAGCVGFSYRITPQTLVECGPEGANLYVLDEHTWTLPPGVEVTTVEDKAVPGMYWQGVARLDGGDR